VQDRAAVAALASGPTPPRVVVTAPIRNTLQQGRRVSRDWDGNGTVDKDDIKAAPVNPGDDTNGDPFIATVPTLAQMTAAALNCLANRDQAGANGFFLHVEGGAVDSANHSNQLARAVEEQHAYLDAVQAVVGFVNHDGDDYTWENTLLILTADHETGLLWGPASKTVPFDPLVSQGAGKLPLAHYNSGSHSNSLVPLMALGAGSGDFASLVDGQDAQAASRFGVGCYVDDTDIYTVMAKALGDGHNVVLMIADGSGFNTWRATQMYLYGVPEPATVVLVGVGGTLLKARRQP
jgi:alkaline phosphatase